MKVLFLGVAFFLAFKFGSYAQEIQQRQGSDASPKLAMPYAPAIEWNLSVEPKSISLGGRAIVVLGLVAEVAGESALG